MDRLVENSQDIGELKKDHISTHEKIEEIKETIFETNGKLDVFEQIHVKLAEQKADVMTCEDNLKYQVKLLNDRMGEIAERSERDHGTFQILTGQCSDVMGELSKLKETYK